MNKINKTITLFLYVSAVVFVYQVAQLHRDLKGFDAKMVWNIDLIRSQYLSDIEMSYKRGCYTGTDYPPEYRQIPTTGFNVNSPTNFCHNKFLEDMEEYSISQIPKLGVPQ